MYKRILVATDGSTLSKKAVSSAIELAALSGAELVAVKVTPRYPQSYFEGSLPLSATEISKIENQWTDAAQKVVDAVAKAAKAKGVSAKAVVVKSDVVSDAVIAAVAAKPEPCVFMLWGNHARKKAASVPGLMNSHHLVLTAPHPSSLSAHAGFLGCRHFSQANAFLEKAGRSAVDWRV